MKNLIREIHRRSLWQVLGIYLAAAWLALQVVDLVIDNFGLPEWVAPFALVLLVIGLPIVLATAFVQEGGPGERPVKGPPEVAERGSPGGSAPTPASPGRETVASGTRVGRRVLTWRNALLGGSGAFALLGLATVGYLVSRATGIGPAGTLVAKGVLPDRSPILVADFEGADAELANTATDAFRIDLAQSQVVKVVEPTEIAQVLERMERTADAPLDLELAREVAVREGIPVVVAGELDRAGDAFVISARLIDPDDGTVLVSDRRTAADLDAVLDAIDALSRRLRERIGESLRELAREEPLARVTTASLPALEKYSAALRAFDLAGDEDRTIALLEEAVALDTAFAMAWRKLGTILNNRAVDRARAVDALERAFRHRDRLTERERYQVEGIYYYQIGPDVTRSITAYENLLAIDPDDSYALNNLGVLYGYLRDNARAQDYYERAAAADSTNTLSLTNAIQEMFAQGDLEGARSGLADARARFGSLPGFATYALALASATGDYEEADREAESLAENHAGSAYWTSEARRYLAASAAVRGRIREARGLLERNLQAASSADDPEAYLRTAAVIAGIEVATLGPDVARGTLESAVARYPMESLEPLDRPYTMLAVQFARAGAAGRAASLLDEMDAQVPVRLRSQLQGIQYEMGRAYVALARERPDEAIELARRADRGFCTTCALVPIGAAYDMAGRQDSALATYRRYVDDRWLWRLEALDQIVLAPMLERLGELYEAAGDLDQAAASYARFVDLWKGADEELQPRVRAAQARLQQIVETRG